MHWVNSLDEELEDFLGLDIGISDGSVVGDYGDITWDGLERMFDSNVDLNTTKSGEIGDGVNKEVECWETIMEEIEEMDELFENQPTGQKQISTQSNPRPSNDQVGNEPLVKNEDGASKRVTTTPTSLDLELAELDGSEIVAVDNPISVDITLEDFEKLFDLSTEPVVTKVEKKVEVEKELMPGTEIEKETVEKRGGESCAKLKVNKDLSPKFKGILEKTVDFIFILTCLEKEKVLQGIEVKDEEYVNFDDFIHGTPIGHGAEKAKCGGEGVYYRRWKDGSIMRETKEWNDAWAKTRDELIISNYVILFDDSICR